MKTRTRIQAGSRLAIALLVSMLAVGTTWAEKPPQKEKSKTEARQRSNKEKAAKKNGRSLSDTKKEIAKGRKGERGKHIASAIKHLKAAGLHDEANRIRQEVGRRSKASLRSEQIERIEDLIERRFRELERNLEQRLAALVEDEAEEPEGEDSEGEEESGKDRSEPKKKPG